VAPLVCVEVARRFDFKIGLRLCFSCLSTLLLLPPFTGRRPQLFLPYLTSAEAFLFACNLSTALLLCSLLRNHSSQRLNQKLQSLRHTFTCQLSIVMKIASLLSIFLSGAAAVLFPEQYRDLATRDIPNYPGLQFNADKKLSVTVFSDLHFGERKSAVAAQSRRAY
jgi:hypothetical protein